MLLFVYKSIIPFHCCWSFLRFIYYNMSTNNTISLYSTLSLHSLTLFFFVVVVTAYGNASSGFETCSPPGLICSNAYLATVCSQTSISSRLHHKLCCVQTVNCRFSSPFDEPTLAITLPTTASATIVEHQQHQQTAATHFLCSSSNHLKTIPLSFI
eukprot:m.129332 g.129332  ORF g.129332 m.129332 type:complete len:156 (+) comp13045_c0_seq1:129-596(+)